MDFSLKKKPPLKKDDEYGSDKGKETLQSRGQHSRGFATRPHDEQERQRHADSKFCHTHTPQGHETSEDEAKNKGTGGRTIEWTFL